MVVARAGLLDRRRTQADPRRGARLQVHGGRLDATTSCGIGATRGHAAEDEAVADDDRPLVLEPAPTAVVVEEDDALGWRAARVTEPRRPAAVRVGRPAHLLSKGRYAQRREAPRRPRRGVLDAVPDASESPAPAGLFSRLTGAEARRGRRGARRSRSPARDARRRQSPAGPARSRDGPGRG